MKPRYLVIALLMFFPAFVVCAANMDRKTQEQLADQKKAKRMNEFSKSRDVDMNFYGKVVDQSSSPVADAHVEIDINRYDSSPTYFFRGISHIDRATDKDGTFKINAIRGSNVFIKNISKKEYEFVYTMNPKCGFSYDKYLGNLHVPDPNKPVIFILRKKETEQTLISPIHITFAVKDKKNVGYNILNGYQVKDIETKPRYTIDNHNFGLESIEYDITFAVRDDGINSKTLVIASPHGGIQFLKEKLYSAPINGYQPKIEITLTKAMQKQIDGGCLYIFSRSPVIYSRIEVNALIYEGVKVNLRTIAVTNYYGTRTFEPNAEIPGWLDVKLTNEAEEAFRRGKRPEKPDIPALIKKGKPKKST